MATIYVQRVLDTGLGQTVTYESVTVSMPTGPTVPPGVGPYDASTHTIVQRYDNAEPGIWPPVAIIADLPTVNVNEGDQCWVIAENAMYYANADGGSWDIASGGGGGGVKPYTYTIGCSAAPYNDTLDVCDFLDPGDGTGIAACLAVAADFRDTIKLRPGDYVIDPALVTLPLSIPFGCTLEGSGSASMITITSGAGGYSQHVFTVNYNSKLLNMTFFVDPPAADTVVALQHIQCAEVCTISNIVAEISVGDEPHSTLAMFRADAGPFSFSNVSVIVEDGFVSTYVFAALMIGDISGAASSENVPPPTVSNLSVDGDICSIITVDASMGVTINNLNHVNVINSGSMLFLITDVPSAFAFRGPLVSNAIIQYTPTSTFSSYAIILDNSNTGLVLGSALTNVSIIGGTAALTGGVNIRNTDGGNMTGFFMSNYTTVDVASMLFAESLNGSVISGIKISNHTWYNTEPTTTLLAETPAQIVGVDLISCDTAVEQIGDVSRLRVIGGEGDVTLDVDGTDNMVIAHHASNIEGGTDTEVAHILPLPVS